MRERLGRACRAARNHAGLRIIDLQDPTGLSEKSLSRFELGRNWSPYTDEIVAAYAAACGTTEHELWHTALEFDTDE